MLRGVFTGEEPLPWGGPLFSHQISGERRETRQASQCCLLQGYYGAKDFVFCTEIVTILGVK